MSAESTEALLIENERAWEVRITAALRESGIGRVTTLGSFAEAEKVLREIDLLRFAIAIIDVRMRKQLFDQGGLALLDIVKDRRPNLPVLMLSAYFDDYPGLKKVTGRYKKVRVIEKDQFIPDARSILESTIRGEPYYDAFISYRHLEPDRSFARDLVKDLEASGYTLAIDERDFAANEAFRDEMERCVRKSRFTLAVISPRYLASSNTHEEATICKVLDMSERRRRLIPLIIEKVTMPIWLYNVVGIDFTAPDSLVPPIEKLKRTMGDAR